MEEYRTPASVRSPLPRTPHTLFISDLHLSAAHKQSAQAFSEFISTQASQAEALYILGDLFEYWAGDDDLHDPFHQHITRTLRKLTAHGTRLFLMRGNRDLLIGKAYAAACGAVLLDDPTLIELYGIPTLLCHGDTLCTDDIEYQNFRKHVHSASFQIDFLSRPLDVRKAHIEQLRKHSDAVKQRKNSEIMDVNNHAVAALLREYHYPRLIHGHTHRPDRHEHIVDDHTCVRWVLGDWDTSANALRVDASNSRWEAFPK
jgi:UDP-2,3-diacylglucosamine hydrolase